MFKMRPVLLMFMTFYVCLSFVDGLLLDKISKPITGTSIPKNITGTLQGVADKINPIKPISTLTDNIQNPIGTITGNESSFNVDILHPIDTLTEFSYNTLNISFFDPSVLDGTLKFNNYDPLALFKSIPEYGKTWMYFPDGNGIPQVVSLQIPEEDDGASSLLYSPTEQYVVFHLYTSNNRNNSQILKAGEIEQLSKSYYNSAKKTKFVIHGWQSSASSGICQEIKNNFLDTYDYNVICVDWSAIASNIIYPIPMFETRKVGLVVANLVDFLVNHGGANVKDIHLLGHSLGAHTCGIAGQNIKSGKVSRITGMDPAFPGFAFIVKAEYRLDATDADLVDIIHTCSGVLGVYANIGHADYFPNGGVPRQPGCDGIPQVIEACSHGRAWKYYARSIKYRDEYVAVLCNSWESFVNGACAANQKTLMGDSVPPTTRGLFYLETSTDI